MIKCDLRVCAVISRAASVKNQAGSGSFLSFSVKVPVSGRDGANKEMTIHVTANSDKIKAAQLILGKRVKLSGVMSVRKHDGKVYYNLRCDDNVELVNSKESDSLEGTMSFRGKIWKRGVNELQDKRGKVFKTFSAFSSDKDGDKVEFTWVRFMYFDPKEGEDFLKADSYVEVNGELQLGVFKDEITLECKVSSVKEWVL